MMKSSLLSAILAWACVLASGLALPQSASRHEPCVASRPRVTDIFTFPLGTWVENIYRRRNGQFLVSLLTPKPDFYLINIATRTASLVATLPDVNGMLGIAEGPRPDTYVVIGANFSASELTGQRGSNGLYTIDMSQYNAKTGKGAKVELSMRVSNATLLDGLAAVNPLKGIYVASDLGAGVIYRLDIRSGKSNVIVADENTAAPTGTIGGADGLKIRNDYMYWTSIGTGIFARVSVDAAGYPFGPSEKLADVGISDDFIFNSKGDAYLTLGTRDVMGVLKAGESQLQEILGRVYGATAVRFGRDRSSLIISTAGNYSQYAGVITRPGKVVQLDLSCDN